jgi:hypothetical protein
MPRVNIVKQFKTESGQWVLRSIPKKATGHYGRRKREPAGRIASQGLEAQRRKRTS